MPLTQEEMKARQGWLVEELQKAFDNKGLSISVGRGGGEIDFVVTVIPPVKETGLAARFESALLRVAGYPRTKATPEEIKDAVSGKIRELLPDSSPEVRVAAGPARMERG